MKKGLTELIFILDKSGSMAGLEKDTIGGYNSMLKKQQEVDGECRITTMLFSDGNELLHDRLDLRAVRPLTEKEYRVGGSTSLLDAIGTAIEKIILVQENTAEEYKAENVLFVIITDGEENTSRRFTAQQVRKMIQHQKERYNWEFFFLGANIDSVETAGRFGIDANRAQNFHADSEGVELNFAVMSDAVCTYRCCSEISDDWGNRIQKDYKKRNRR